VEIDKDVLSAAEGLRETLRCNVTGPFSFGDVEIVWIRNGHMTLPANVEDRQNGTLIFTQLHASDAGVYVCHAYDRRKQTSAFASTVVRVERPKKQARAPFAVKVTGRPPSVAWQPVMLAENGLPFFINGLVGVILALDA